MTCLSFLFGERGMVCYAAQPLPVAESRRHSVCVDYFAAGTSTQAAWLVLVKAPEPVVINWHALTW